MRLGWLAAGAALASLGWVAYDHFDRRPGNSRAGLDPDMHAARPISAGRSDWIEDLTWMEVRDAIASGKRTVIVPTGGIEQNGPYVASGKHNVILRGTAPEIARRLGNALIAPVIRFVPEGTIDPPDGHMRYPGTIGVTEETYRALVRDVVTALRFHGFDEIILIGDSGGNQDGLAAVAAQLDQPGGARVYHIPEYYDWDDRADWLAAQGFREVDQGYHDELSVEAMMLAVDPETVRMEQRVKAGKFSINGVPLEPVGKMQAVGRQLIAHIAGETVAAIERRRNEQ